MRFVTAYNNTQNNGVFQLDIVGFLAILGEGSIETVQQVLTLSNLIYLPRLIPAPQVLLKVTRPDKLETVGDARVVGVHSGNAEHHIHFIAHAFHRGDKLAPNSVTCIHVTEDENKQRPSPKRFGPLAFVATLGFGMSALLVGLSIYWEDGMALLATFMLSTLSSVTGIANKWTPTKNDPRPDKHSPPGNVVIKYSQGALLVVKCSEQTARYLYFNPSQRCQYTVQSTTMYRFLSLIGTLLLMGGVICLANAKIQTQTAFAGMYMGINVAYWLIAAMPPARHWDLSRLKTEKIELHGGTPPRDAAVKLDENPTYTEALWKAIAVTGSKDWVREAGWCPKTPAWDEWLHEAEEAAEQDPMKESTRKNDDGSVTTVWTIRNWDFRGALSTKLQSRPTFSTFTGRKLETV